MAGVAIDVRLNELLAALSLACDVGNDFPIEKGLRNTHAAVRVGVEAAQVTAIRVAGLLHDIGRLNRRALEQARPAFA